MDNKFSLVSLVSMLMVISFMMMPRTVLACTADHNNDRSGCKDCIVDQMKYDCPTCIPILRCMARCLWGGSSKGKCISKCDCHGGKPKLSDCKTCMARCKCSCVA
ncbi:hypothetical protein ACFE04_001972 [Oxalis oulophora]